MDGAKGSALEWALALLQAPGERHALRRKPLPAGVDRLLGIAAGLMPDALAEAVRIYDEPEGRIRDAARFYAREILFFPQADAYRVLGVDAGANSEQIKAHHRLLQHWLHPDRLRNEDDEVFAARVNTAWNHLRTPERRQAYDAALAQDRPQEDFADDDARRGARTWVSADESLHDGWRQRLPMLALLGACLLLVVLVLRDMGRRPEAWDLPERRASTDAIADDAMGIAVPQRASADVAAISPTADGRRARMPRLHESASPASRIAQPLIHPMPAGVPASAMAKGATVPPSATSPASASAEPASEPAQPPAQATPPSTVHAAPSQRPSATEAVAPSFARIQSARHAGEQFLRYMGAPDRPAPPIWNSPAIQSSADRLRQDLHSAGPARLSGPQWRIGNDTAVLKSGYTVQEQETDAGSVTADLIWREGHWLVTGLSMERAR